MGIEENIRRIRTNMLDAAEKSGRDVKEIELIAVTKYVDKDRILKALECGISTVGENRVQELTAKMDDSVYGNARVDFIGQLQTNKVKYIIGKVRLIQSVDRLALLKEINSRAEASGLVQDILIEVNIGGELQKGGAAAEGLPSLLDAACALPHVRVKGLMCIPPPLAGDGARRYFSRMRGIYERIREEGMQGVEMEHLSMGMSGDYEAAIQEGATMIRVGTGIFGARG